MVKNNFSFNKFKYFYSRSILIFFIFLIFVSIFFIEYSYAFEVESFYFGGILNSFYRTAEIIEITGNEDTYNGVFSPFILYKNYFNSYDLFFEFLFDFNIPLSDKGRFYSLFNPPIIRIKTLYFSFYIFENISIYSGYIQNKILNYRFENYNPPIIYKTPAYPMSNYNLPYFDNKNSHNPFAFVLGDRFLPLYYANSANLMDFYFSFKFEFKPLLKTTIEKISNEKSNLNLTLDKNYYFFYFFDKYFKDIYSFAIDIGTSNGEEGLDSNSSKQFYFSLSYKSGIFELFDIKDNLYSRNYLLYMFLFYTKNFNKFFNYFLKNSYLRYFSNYNEGEIFTKNSQKDKSLADSEDFIISGFNFVISCLIGERGSVPAKVRNDQFSIYLEYIFIKKNFSFNFAIEVFLTFHGFTKSKINPYDPSFNNFVFDTDDPNYNSFWNLILYNYNDGYLLPDDLPNYNILGESLKGMGGFIYFSFIFSNKFKFIISFSSYDSNIFSNNYIVYEPKYKFVFGFEFKINDQLFFFFSFIFIKDKVFENYVQFFEAESRSDHYIANYDLFFSLIFYF